MTDRLRVAWFAPNAGNWVTYRMEHQVANALADAGHEVTMIQCDRVLDAYCQVMTPLGLTADSRASQRHAACRECGFAADLTRPSARYQTAWLGDFLTPQDHAWVDDVMRGVTPSNWEGLVANGIPVGRFSSYTSMLHHKRATVAETSESWAEYRADLRNGLLMSRASPLILDIVDPTHGVVYNALYPANRVFAETVLAASIPLVSLSAGPSAARRFSTLAVYDGIRASQTTVDSESFRTSLRVPCSPNEIRHVERHVEQLIVGTDPWVYSAAPSRRPASEIREGLGLRANVPVVTVLVSSPDETRSALLVDAEYHRAAADGYSDVAEYLRATAELAASSPGVDFVFRLHPRLAPNKRERRTSPDLAALYEALSDLPANAVINRPADGWSLYDLVAVSSVAVNQSSSAGLEFLAFGLPVVQYDPPRLGAYPQEFALPVPRHDRAALRAALAEGLADGWDLRHAVDAYRWYASLQIRSVIHLEALEDLVSVEMSKSKLKPALPAPRGPRSIARVIPGPVKAEIARRIVRRERARDVLDTAPDSENVRRLEASIRAARVEGDVWEPQMMHPIESDPTVEETLVQEAVMRLARYLPTHPLDGVGVLRDAALTPP